MAFRLLQQNGRTAYQQSYSSSLDK